MNDEERRQVYKSLWAKMKRAEHEDGFDRDEWERQLDKYRAPARRKFNPVKPSQTAEYARKKANRYRARHPETHKMYSDRSAFRWSLKHLEAYSDRQLRNLETLLNQLLENKSN